MSTYPKIGSKGEVNAIAYNANSKEYISTTKKSAHGNTKKGVATFINSLSDIKMKGNVIISKIIEVITQSFIILPFM